MNEKRKETVMLKRLKIAVAAAIALIIGFFGWTGQTLAQQIYPSRAIDLVVPFAAGGAGDTWVRIIMPYLSQKWGVPINVVNRTGGSGAVGVMSVLTAPPDGYTILFDGLVTPAITAIQANAPFKWDDTTPIAKITSAPLAFAVTPDSLWETFDDAIAELKKNPEAYKAGVGHVGAPAVFALARLFETIGIDPTRIPRVVFDGSTPTMAALAGKHVAYTAQPLSDTLPLMDAGKLRILAVSSATRVPTAPSLPTGQELGYPTFDLGTWGVIHGPKNLPPEIVQKWSEGLKEALQNREIIDKLAVRQTLADYLGPEETKAFLAEEYKVRLAIAQRLGLRK
jgi:tripartite-type tricarboxylate transporter receptor subunit TctC